MQFSRNVPGGEAYNGEGWEIHSVSPSRNLHCLRVLCCSRVFSSPPLAALPHTRTSTALSFRHRDTAAVIDAAARENIGFHAANIARC